ncbi:MAG: hypothetical protein EZS26_001152 [Candidatus Ordinivivax streblomastigis]|uniref:alpha-L-fucosidase n=1 Tax=Candidatus Ordinivivax streblomastigis TaxID=2540710 RepID=A0A5M8P2F0_9BACT|nr:MAG: hypothetical protein EZS26_001152 [Candidatus Ordinivivax streblomastigis]
MKRKISLLLLLFAFIFTAPNFAQSVNKERTPLEHGAHRLGKRTDAAMQHWRKYGLGQFIHWGVYAIPGGQWDGKNYMGAAEWIRSWSGMPKQDYDNLYKQFNPVDFDAAKWAKQAKQMGAKYLIFTTKHHDGFCMWPSNYTDYTVANTPYKKDIVKALVDAYTAEGIDVYLYFSIIDWNQPGYRSVVKTERDKAEYEQFKQFTRNQLIELLTNYPQVKGLWFDGSWDKAWIEQAAWVDALGEELRTIRPGLIIGSRFRADDTGKRHVDANGDLIDDYDQRFERNLPANLKEVGGNDWECVMTIPENQWGYHRDWSWSYVKTSDDLIEMMAKTRSLDGNFVINFGPDGKGNIRKEESDIAKSIGQWLSINGDAVYDVQHSLLEKQDWGYSTQKDHKIYLTVFNKPANNLVRVKLPKSKTEGMIYVIGKAQFLLNQQAARIKGNGKPATYFRDKFGNSYYDIILPKAVQKCTQAFVIELELKEIDKKDLDNYQQAII